MKRTLYFLMLTCFLAQAHDGTVNITGTFRINSCILAQDSRQINVSLGDISLTRFAQGRYGPEKSFIVNLQDCGADSVSVDVTFSGTPDNGRAELLALDSGSAKGLGIAILDDTKAIIPINQVSKDYPLHQGSVPLTFYAQLRPTGENIQSGNINASATFVLHYD